VYNNADPAAYPISSYSYMIVPTTFSGVFQGNAKGYTLGQFVKYVVCDGQKQAGALGYSPLPNNLVKAAFEQIKRIPSSGVGDYNEQSCSNGGAAAGENPTSGAGDNQQQAPGAAAGAGGDAAAATSGGGDGAVAADAEAVYDANGNLVSGSAASAGGASAVSSPFTLASDGWRTPQWIMLVAGVLLFLAILLPPIIMSRTRRHASNSS
jgi:phosphate transport system substrate-binding protein